MSDIQVYVEGGGSSKEQKAELRRGFDALFSEQKANASGKRIGLVFICCGGRQEAYEAFRNALDVNPQRANALLVDSESLVAPVSQDRPQDALARRAHLMRRDGAGDRGQGDGWNLAEVAPKCIHLMVQCMEAWIVSDPDALQGFYKQGFRGDRLPQRPNLDEEPKPDVYRKLEAATEPTQKGKYAKIRHESHLMQRIQPERVAARCPRFSTFRAWLNERIDDQPAAGRGARRG